MEIHLSYNNNLHLNMFDRDGLITDNISHTLRNYKDLTPDLGGQYNPAN